MKTQLYRSNTELYKAHNNGTHSEIEVNKILKFAKENLHKINTINGAIPKSIVFVNNNNLEFIDTCTNLLCYAVIIQSEITFIS